MARTRTIIRVSSSISNWREKILKRYKAEEYVWWRDLFRPVTFFGLYRPWDFLLFFLHRGSKICHWQGSDVLQAGWHFRWLQRIKAKHICENEVEQGVLRLMLQQEVEVRPTFLSNPHEFKVTYKQSETPKVWLHINHNAELESGLETLKKVVEKVGEVEIHVYGRCKLQNIPNFVFHGYVPEAQFNKEIKDYQAAARLHEFDGFAETLSKSVLNGQYPISRIRYPHIDTYKDEEELIKLLKDLKNKMKPNYKARDFYLKQFTKKW